MTKGVSFVRNLKKYADRINTKYAAVIWRWWYLLVSKNNKWQTQMLKKRKEKTPKNEPYTEVNIYEKWQASHRGIEEFFLQKLYWRSLWDGRSLERSSRRTQTTAVLLRWKYVIQAAGRALYTLIWHRIPWNQLPHFVPQGSGHVHGAILYLAEVTKPNRNR